MGGKVICVSLTEWLWVKGGKTDECDRVTRGGERGGERGGKKTHARGAWSQGD